MYYLDKLADKFWDIERWARDLKDDLYGWPWPLSYLGYPFDLFRYHMWYAAYYTDHISSWADGIDDRIGDILSWYDIYYKIKAYFPIVEKTWYDITNYVRTEISKIDLPYVPSYSEIFAHIKAMCVSAWNILSHSWSDVHGLVMTYLDTLQDWSQESWSTFMARILAALPHIPSIDDVINYVCDRFESILDRLFKEGE